MPEIAAAAKVAHHADKLGAYLRGEPVFPATLELDLTTECNKNCRYCASTLTVPRATLPMGFVDRLLGLLEGRTRGLLLTGGEPTMAPTFPDTLRLARERGFEDVVVVTNGTLLDEGPVAGALLERASAVRVSVYDWAAESASPLSAVLRSVEALRSRIDREGSALEIGISALTKHGNAGGIDRVVDATVSAGAHWVYFHPFCVRWDDGAPEQVDQADVLAVVTDRAAHLANGFRVYTFPDRYSRDELTFTGYHAAHFLLVVGGDGMNYLAPEVKYHRENVIADLSNGFSDGFLWEPQRLKRIAAVTSETYPAMRSRHRGVLYNDLIEKLRSRAASGAPVDGSAPEAGAFVHPHIL